jgi:hypothetical protein
MDLRGRDRIAMSQKERDVLAILRTVISGERSQAEAARLPGLVHDQATFCLSGLNKWQP